MVQAALRTEISLRVIQMVWGEALGSCDSLLKLKMKMANKSRSKIGSPN